MTKELDKYDVKRKKKKDGNYVWTIQGVKDFDAKHIFDCGQCFRWREQPDGSWTGIAGGRIANIGFDNNILTIESLAGISTPKDFQDYWFDYLDLGRDYGAIKRKLSRGDDVMKSAIKGGQGIRILNQDLWETIVSFIISQNNNIPRIKGCTERLAKLAGEPLVVNDRDIDLGDMAPYNLPTPEKLAAMTVEGLAPVRLGYRARYLIETAQAVVEKGLPESMDDLGALCGVGPKVANCIGLFGLHKYNSFPIDVWVKRVMHDLYGFDEGDNKGMAAYAEEHFGELSGFAQQYLFYYIRETNR